MTAPDQRAVTSRPRSIPRLLAVLALLLIGVSLLLEYWARQKQEAVQTLPGVERQQLYQRTLENYRTVCSPQPRPELKERCQQDAEFLVLFQECDASCRSLIADQLPKPTR